MASDFAQHFGGSDHARLAGFLHDLGKVEAEFQQRLRHVVNPKEKDGEKKPHAHHGAALLLEEDDVRGGPVWPVAFAINGHHAGLHNRPDLQKRAGYRVRAVEAERALAGDTNWNGVPWPVKHFGPNLPKWLDDLPFSTPEERATKLRAVDLYTRFLFSALVDADRLDTEANLEETRDNFAKRQNWRLDKRGLAAIDAVASLLRQLDEAIKQRRQAAKDKGTSEPVLEVRDQVLQACVKAARQPRGIFTLTVPTGGGKTLASVYLALKHIEVENQRTTDLSKNLRRIIIVIPYLNIIQQTALELKKVFGDLHWDQNARDWIPADNPPVVLEHHSQAQDPEPPSGKQAEKGDADDYSRERTLRQLAAENWDAPIVVTTSVQFFDSLFSRRPADARKLHNIAQSVIIFDEVQTFPPRLMQPILDVLGELTNPERRYGCSLVLCTATQPALLKSEDLPFGLERVTAIIPQPKPMFHQLKRTIYPEMDSPDEIPTLSWDQLAKGILQLRKRQALVVVNTRRHARELFAAVQQAVRETDGLTKDTTPNCVFHLSTWMTPAHRIEVLETVQGRLEDGEPCLLVSTQCIEAGVDVDFPTVWRAFGPYDAIVQAAGRCNRNGVLKDEQGNPSLGVVHVFRPEEDRLPTGIYKTATSQTELLRKMAAAKPHDPVSFETYFRLLYQLSVPDDCEIQRERAELHFETVSVRFNFIEAFSVPLLITNHNVGATNLPVRVRYDNGDVELNQLVEKAKDNRFFTPAEWRCLQPHIISLDYRDAKTAPFLNQCAALVFKSDGSQDGLHRLTATSLYHGGLNGAGLDCLHQDLSSFSIL